MIGLCGYPGMLGWSRSAMLKTSGGQPVPGGVAIFTSQAHPGTLFHDCGPRLGRSAGRKRVLPRLYDHDLQEKYPTRDRGWEKALINMGYWDPMSCHMISFDGITPSGNIVLDQDQARMACPGEDRRHEPGRHDGDRAAPGRDVLGGGARPEDPPSPDGRGKRQYSPECIPCTKKPVIERTAP